MVVGLERFELLNMTPEATSLDQAVTYWLKCKKFVFPATFASASGKKTREKLRLKIYSTLSSLVLLLL